MDRWGSAALPKVDHTRRVTPMSLAHEGLDWLLYGGFLGALRGDPLRQAMAALRWADFRRGEDIVALGEPPPGVALIAAGEATVDAPAGGPGDGFETIARIGPGHLVGERSAREADPARRLPGARVRAATAVRALLLDGVAFRRQLAIPAVARYVDDLVRLRARSREILDRLLQCAEVRDLSREDLERFAQSGRIVSFEAGEPILSAGRAGTRVYLLLEGTVSTRAPSVGGREGRLFRTASPGEDGAFFGHVSVLHNRPRTADVRADTHAELLAVDDRVFVRVLRHNPPVWRRITQAITELEFDFDALRHQSPALVVELRGERGLGTTTLGYGLAGALAREGPVTLLDVAGARTAQVLSLPERGGRRKPRAAGVPIGEAELPSGWGLRLVWPRAGADAGAVLNGLLEEARRAPAADTASRGKPVIVVVGAAGEPAAGVHDAVEVLVVVRRSGERLPTLGLREEGVRLIQAIRVDLHGDLPAALTRDAVRLPADPLGAATFWRRRDLDAIATGRSRLGEAVGRLARLLRNRSVGLALGGGGALGFGHIGLIEAMAGHDPPVPIDYVAGASFGAVVGAVYAVAGLEGLREMRRPSFRRRMHRASLLSVATLAPVGRLVEELTGGCRLEESVIPFFPVSLDIWTGVEVVLASGSLAEAVQASSSFPGVIPAHVRGVQRLVDGGIKNNVPASVVWDAGADFVIASNIIPPHPVGRTPELRSGWLARLKGATVWRVNDVVRSLFLMMSQTGLDRATLADYLFDFRVEGFSPGDFRHGDRIRELGAAQAAGEIGRIADAWRRTAGDDLTAAASDRGRSHPGGA